MDAVLSLLFLPSLSSYSASLQFLLFSLTWATLILSNDPIQVEIIGSLAIRLLFFVLPSTIFLLFDSLLPSVAAGVKIQGEKGLPSQTPGGKRKSGGGPKLWLVVAVSLGNVLLAVAMQAGVEALLTLVLEVRSAVKVTSALPLPWTVAKDLLKGLVAREVIQYITHRYLLHPRSSKTFLARYHNDYFHAITSPYSFVAYYDHPLPFMLKTFLPLYLPAAIFRFHLLTYFIFLMLVSIEETISFSGYVVPSILFRGVAQRQILHMASHGKGNFAEWGILDWAAGSSLGASVGEDVAEEMQKHQVPEKASGAMQGMKRATRRKTRQK